MLLKTTLLCLTVPPHFTVSVFRLLNRFSLKVVLLNFTLLYVQHLTLTSTVTKWQYTFRYQQKLRQKHVSLCLQLTISLNRLTVNRLLFLHRIWYLVLTISLWISPANSVRVKYSVMLTRLLWLTTNMMYHFMLKSKLRLQRISVTKRFQRLSMLLSEDLYSMKTFHRISDMLTEQIPISSLTLKLHSLLVKNSFQTLSNVA